MIGNYLLVKSQTTSCLGNIQCILSLSLSLTLIHVPGEAGEDPAQRCGVEEVHGAEQELLE